MASSLEKEIHDLMAAMTPVVSQENCAKMQKYLTGKNINLHIFNIFYLKHPTLKWDMNAGRNTIHTEYVKM